MAIPKYQELMLPLLELHADGQDHTASDLEDGLASHFVLTEADLDERIPSGGKLMRDRLHWARHALVRALLLERPARGQSRITERGRALLAERPAFLDNSVLSRYPEFVEWRAAKGGTAGTNAQGIAPEGVSSSDSELSPEERIDAAYSELQRAIEAELLERLLSMPPSFFEELVVKLLIALGYGGGDDSGVRLGGAGDGGVDGEIREDALGLEKVYIQAKRWASGRTVGRPEVQEFAGSLDMHRARKGVFITTSAFSAEARDFVSRIEKSIVLIDGARLARLMFETNLGLAPTRTLQLKRIDSDFFSEPDDL